MYERLEVFYIDNLPAYAYLPFEFAKRNNIRNGYIGPRNIKWQKKVNFSSPLEYLSEKTKKKVLRAKEYALSILSYKIESNQTLNHADFTEWLSLYNKNIEKKELGISKIDANWFEKIQDTNKYGSLFIRDASNKIIAGVIIRIDKLKNEISCDYRAHEYLKIKDSSLSAILEMCIDEYALSGGYKSIVRGTDENLYGIRLSVGLMEFKKHYGFTPTAMDYNSTYYNRVLIFFKEFNNIITYEYSKGGVTEMIIQQTEVYPFNQLINLQPN